jgi:hypothetical protein
MKDPSKLLDRIFPVLSPQASVLLCVPNLRHLYVLDLLLSGEWNYTERGLLDRTHLHFFTFRTLTALLQEKKLFLQEIIPILNNAEWFGKIIAPNRVSGLLRERLGLMLDYAKNKKNISPLLEGWFPGYKYSEQDAIELMSAQYVVSAKRGMGFKIEG